MPESSRARQREGIRKSGRTLPLTTPEQRRYYKTKRRYAGFTREQAVEAALALFPEPPK